VRRDLKLLVCLVVLGVIGFASASMVNGANAGSADTTTGTTASTTGTTAATTGTTASTTGTTASTTGTTASTTGTTTTTPPPTVTVTTSNTVTRTVVVIKKQAVVLCHRSTHGRFLTIRVRLNVGVLAAHLRHGDATGRCTAAKIRLMKKHLH